MDCLELLLAPESPAPSACFVLDEARLLANAAILDSVQQATGVKILLALKGFAAWAVFPLLSRKGFGPLWGVCASSVDEARLGREDFGGEVHAFAAAWNEEEFRELLKLCDHIVFNSVVQWRRFSPLVETSRQSAPHGREISIGFRLNPEHSEGTVPLYDPCAPGSRLGIRPSELARQLAPQDLADISGLHFHTLCQQGADALERTLKAVERKFGPYLPGRRWLNFGGGHHITRPDYDRQLLCRLLKHWRNRYQAQIYLEPGEAVALNAGWLTATVLDVVEADMPVAVLDVSAACHMPDVLEMPYRPDVYYLDETGAPGLAADAGKGFWTCRLAGKSCLAGDVMGEYAFAAPLTVGQRLVFADMAIYSMVKTTTFNGLRLPSIGICHCEATHPEERFRLLKRFGYTDFRERLS